MLVSNKICYNLASQKKSISHTFNEKTTFFRHKFGTEQLRIYQFCKQKLNLFFYLWKRLYIWAFF